MSSQHKKIGKFCKYPFCETTSNRMIRQPSHYSKKNFYKFPKDSRLAKWKKVCNIHPNVKCTHFYICEDHFLPSDFMLNCPIKLNSKAIPKERSMPEEIKEHNYAVSPKDFISTEQSHKKKYEKNTQMHINWARASTDDKINFLNSFFENQENLMCAKPNSQKSIKQDEASPNFICSEQSELNVKTMKSSRDTKNDCINGYNSLNINFFENEQTLIDSKSFHEKTLNTRPYVQPNSLTDLTIIDGSLILFLPVQVGLPPSESNMDISDNSAFQNYTLEKNNSDLPFQITSVYSLSDSKSRETN
ncbi:uncharacterized protein LOC123677714 isoform X2 [Harmonia axyridis]|nr:uncharacterized protein LOC123677714 isoform X2 [Harmonia axyridis]XP_045470355.1 uncharacterized protein LOC123677714 isoform X2 [Harmonia axyridis]